MTVLPSETEQHDWLSILSNWSYAYGRPVVAGRIKVEPEDFRVCEQMGFEPSGEGEHIWLRLIKRRQNTDQLARQLARFCGVAYRDVSYSGQKDFFAVTEQWFSVWLPRGEQPDWPEFSMNGVTIIQAKRHHRKIKRGSHSANNFHIVIRDLASQKGAHPEQLEARLEIIRQCGVPNYFGPQRFGHNADNMRQARQMLAGSIKVRNRNLRSLLLSAARSWLFNAVLSERIRLGTWQSLYQGEPANLDGSGSFFNAERTAQELNRLLALDIHPTAPMWGEAPAPKLAIYQELHELELSIVKNHQDIADGLSDARLAYQRRPLRIKVNQLEWQLADDQLEISFSLHKGQFATSVLRELLVDPTAEVAEGA